MANFPETGKPNKVYFYKDENDKYRFYFWVGDKYEGVGSAGSLLIRKNFDFTNSQSFVVEQDIAVVIGVFVSGQGVLDISQYSVSLPRTITINDTLESGDKIVILYGNVPNGVLPYYTQAEIDVKFAELDAENFQNPVATYDIDGNLERIDYDNDKFKTFTYDVDGKLTEINVNDLYKLELAYDTEGRWLSTTKIVI